jgi:hypothetical protein
MPEKKSTVRREADAVQEHVIQPVGEALGVAEGEASRSATQTSAAARMMTRSLAGPKPAAVKGKTKRAASAAKPPQWPAAGAGRKGPRRGASKGR